MPGQKFGPAWFPGVVASGLGICGELLVASGVRQGARWLVVPDWFRSRRALLGVGSVIAGLAFYIFAADRLGFYITGTLLLAFWMRVLGTSWRWAVAIALIATVAIHFSFYKLLRIPLPWGVLESYAF
jgi:putative tricarboxylic transport membrane protein